LICRSVDRAGSLARRAQAIGRVFRYGQTRPTHVYRLVAARTMEAKIYRRQVTKLGLARAVVDDAATGRHYSPAELDDLLNLDDEDEDGDMGDGDGAEGGDAVADAFDPKSVLGRLLAGRGSSGARGRSTDAAAAAVGGAAQTAVLSSGAGGALPLGAGGAASAGRWVVKYHRHEPLMAECAEEQSRPPHDGYS
jgi:hypothetical protein